MEMRKVTIITLLFLFILLNLSFINSEINISDNDVEYESEILEKFNVQSELNVIVRIKDTSSIDMNIDKSELEKQLEERDKRLDAISKEVISNLNEDELKSYRLGLSGGFSGVLTKKGFDKLITNNKVRSVLENIPVYLTVNDSARKIEANNTWTILNYTGRGIKVCIIDSGVNASHPDLIGKIKGQYCYCQNYSYGSDTDCCDGNKPEGNNATDYNGHGTHVAGIIASQNLTYRGIAPDSDLYVVKVTNSSGSGAMDDVGRAIRWCRINASVNVISISLGDKANHPGKTPCPTAIDEEINDTYNLGITLIAASGNEDYSNGTNYPSCVENVISVGATKLTDTLEDVTNRGPNLDLLAPGKDITSLRWNPSGNHPLCTESGNLMTCTGSSQAAPHVSGVIALMLEKNKTLTPDNILLLLKGSGPLIQNWTRVDAYNAVQSMLSNCGNLNRENGAYVLLKNISSGGTCLNITANNIKLDGRGYTINYGINISGHGVYVNGYNNIKIINLSIEMKNMTSINSKGIYFLNGNNQNVTYTSLNIGGRGTFDSLNYGIYLRNTSNSQVFNNKINTSNQKGYGVFIHAADYEDSSNNLINNNSINITKSQSFGVYIYGTNGGIAEESKILSNKIKMNDSDSHGVYIRISVGAGSSTDYNYLYNNFITTLGTSSYSVNLESSSNNLIKDSNFSSLKSYDILIAGTNNTFINVTYLNESVSGDLTRKWYLDVKVNDSVGNINQANVTGRNVSGSVQFSTLTNSTGMITRQEVIEYINVRGVKNFYTNYNITASKSNYSTMYQLVNMSMNRYLTFTLQPNKIIFMTNLTYNGDLNGTVGADQLCMADPNKPASGTYKALVGTLNRQISGNDWILKVNTTYTRVNTSILIDTTNSQKWFIFNLENSITTDPKYVWTGLYENGSVSIYNCDNWTTTSGDGTVGDSNTVSSDSIYYTEKSCPLGGRTIYCVEQ